MELIDAVRLVTRLHDFGWRIGGLTYGTSQWARNFTFAMFYAFNLAVAARDPLATDERLAKAVLNGIVTYGPYAVLFFLLLELTLMARSFERLGLRQHAP